MTRLASIVGIAFVLLSTTSPNIAESASGVCSYDWLASLLGCTPTMPDEVKTLLRLGRDAIDRLYCRTAIGRDLELCGKNKRAGQLQHRRRRI